jgi:osmotically-inducible protein OsmY
LHNGPAPVAPGEHHVTRLLILALSIVVPSCDKADANTQDKPADNTKKNERDRDGDTKTPLDQNENKADIDISAAIRKAVVADDALSMGAKNVKIITADGVVTLRGPVATADEKQKIAKLAQDTAGVQRVDDQLEIAPE